MDQEVKLIWKKDFWGQLYRQLRVRGKGETESGAFLLGQNGSKQVTDILYYDDLEDGCLDSGAIHLTYRAFMRLTDYCQKKQLTVKADIHTHPAGITSQSKIDRENPLIKIKGHMALIVPHYAIPAKCDMNNLGIYEFLGNGYHWKTYHFREGVIKVI